MAYPVYYVPSGDVLPVLFSTYDGGTGASLTMSGLAVTDIEIYKDGSVTQRSSDAGYTLLDTDGIDFDSLTGIHGFSIDTSDNTDAGFYTVGAWYHVVVSSVTVDAQTVSFIACAFRLMAAESVAAKPKVDVDAWLGTAAATPTTAGIPEVDVTHWNGTAVTTPPAVNCTQISGDTTAADNLEAALDGTGSVTITAALTGNITGNLSGSVGSVTGAVGSVTGNVGGNVAGSVGSVTGNVGGNVAGTVGSLAAQAKADVNAEVVDALNTDTYAEPGQGAPGATVSLVQKIGFLYKAWRNKHTQTATEYALYADDTTTKDQEAVVSDDATTFERGEVGTGL
jgi:hypothetical protein